MDELIKKLIKLCSEGKETYLEKYKDFYLCLLPYDYKRSCNYQKNKVGLPRFVNNHFMIRNYYICGRKEVEENEQTD